MKWQSPALLIISMPAFRASMSAYMIESTAFLRGLVLCLQHMV